MFTTLIIWVNCESKLDYNMIRKQFWKIEFVKGSRDEIVDLFSLAQRNIFVFDDKIAVARLSKSVADLFN